MGVSAKAQFDYIAEALDKGMRGELYRRGQEVTGELRRAETDVLSGPRHGKKHKGLGNRSSVPGEPPAAQSGDLRKYWDEETTLRGNGRMAKVTSRIRSGEDTEEYAQRLQDGDSRIEARPFIGPIIEKAKPEAIRIYGEPYSSHINLSRG